ncbi:protocadherin-8 [Erpetoichthys calabaricus]|uniref:protocadherin-8 n=1 Tax=Erpetoichthys calabaricus TaxID=27687 RepID=UPI0022345375|nr:protocadherin-8 [Erpetoichthys calabaricus]
MLLNGFTVVCRTVQYSVYEEDAPGTEIGNLARDLNINPADDPQTSFRFMEQPNTTCISLKEANGLLTIGERIDREEICKQASQCRITFDIISFSMEKYQLIHVQVEVKDINDHSPQFVHNESYIEISESSLVGSRFPLEVAVDWDVGPYYIQTYHISYDSHFGIEVHSREDGVKYAELVLGKPLDREIEDSYSLQLVATDGGNPPRSGAVTVNIKVTDYNDNSPSFENNVVTVELNEDAPVGFLLLTLNAVDPDEGVNGEVLYGFGSQVSTEILQTFQLDPSSGRLSLKALVDFEKRTNYELLIQAYDLGLNSIPTTCKVLVEVLDVNDNAPEINIKPMTSASAGVAYITEAAAKDSFVALISTSDRDSGANGYVKCSIYGHEHFKLQQAYEDSYMIVTTATLDREKIAEYNLTVTAEDLGSPPFKTIKQYTIRVSDENDNPPLFSKSVYEVSVVENNVPGSYITTVVARDPDLGHNSKVTYKIISSETSGPPLSSFVSIDPATGSIYSVRSFNYEMIKQIEMKVRASDSGTPQLSSTATIRLKIVDQNDNFPFITNPILMNGSADLRLPNNAPPGYLAVHLKARDLDDGVNSELSYKILQDRENMFTLNKQTGEISLKHGLSYVTGDVLRLTVAVNDNGRPSLSSTAVLNFIVTETYPEDELVIILPSSEEQPEWDASLIVIIMLGGGCALLLVAIIAVAISCKRHRTHKTGKSDIAEGQSSVCSTRYLRDLKRGLGDPREAETLFESQKAQDANKKVFIPGNPFSEADLQTIRTWQEENCVKNADQLSTKDSGQGDSDFNDSDSDISGDGSKKIPTTFNAVHNGTFNSAQSGIKFCMIPIDGPPSYGNGYSIAYSQTSVYNPKTEFRRAAYQTGHHPWRDTSYRTNLPKTKGLLQAIPRTGPVPALQLCYENQAEMTQTERAPQLEKETQETSAVLHVATSF